MYVITNRNLEEGASGENKLGSRPSPQGPNELRLVEATKKNGKWNIKILPDKPTAAMKKEVGLNDDNEEVFTSQYVARKILSTVRKQKKNLVFFVHGFNNNVKVVLDRAQHFADNFGVEVIPFSWPANGGGFLNIEGSLSYKSDKHDALASVGALNRCLVRMFDYLAKLNSGIIKEADDKTRSKYGSDAERRNVEYIKLVREACPFKINFVAHSMGNYLYKHMLSSSTYDGNKMLFDNVLLVAADTNNENHAAWVDKIRFRNRLYITINEDDFALRLSDMKGGDQQLPRLGHFPNNLYAQNARYIDFTNVPKVGDSHAYFEGDPLKNLKVKDFFTAAFNGDRAEEKAALKYDAAINMYRFKAR